MYWADINYVHKIRSDSIGTIGKAIQWLSDKGMQTINLKATRHRLARKEIKRCSVPAIAMPDVMIKQVPRYMSPHS